MRVLVAGANGLVGNALVTHCRLIGDEVFAHSHQALDITNDESVTRIIEQQRPEIVINCAAWTDVDGSEFDRERAFQVNAHGPASLARISKRAGAVFVTVSTDYVFDGMKDGFYTQLDEPNPLSIYGMSKLEGELRAREANPKTIIVRTGFVFGSGGKNFLSSIVARVRRGERVQAIHDARGTPTFAADLAERLRELAVLDRAEVFHVVNSGTGASYEEFARFAVKTAGLDEETVEPVSVTSLCRPARRPANSCLRCLISESLNLVPMPDWQTAVRKFVTHETLPIDTRAVAPARP